jgi:hypothetical protein
VEEIRQELAAILPGQSDELAVRLQSFLAALVERGILEEV